MSTSPLVTDQIHKHHAQVPHPEALPTSETVQVPLPVPKVWSSLELPSLNLSDPIGTHANLLVPPAPSPSALKKVDLVPTPPSRVPDPAPALDRGLAERMAQLRTTSAGLRRQAEAVTRTTGTIK